MKKGRWSWCFTFTSMMIVISRLVDMSIGFQIFFCFLALPRHAPMTGCKTRENSNFLKNGKMVISVKIQKFSRPRMMKRTSPLESSSKI